MINCHHFSYGLKCSNCGKELRSYDAEYKRYETLGYEIERRESKIAWLDEAKKRIETGGPLALSEHIVLKQDEYKRLWLKVIDVKKGYWAEAPLTPEVAAILGMKLGQQIILTNAGDEGVILTENQRTLLSKRVLETKHE